MRNLATIALPLYKPPLTFGPPRMSRRRHHENHLSHIPKSFTQPAPLWPALLSATPDCPTHPPPASRPMSPNALLGSSPRVPECAFGGAIATPFSHSGSLAAERG